MIGDQNERDFYRMDRDERNSRLNQNEQNLRREVRDPMTGEYVILAQNSFIDHKLIFEKQTCTVMRATSDTETHWIIESDEGYDRFIISVVDLELLIEDYEKKQEKLKANAKLETPELIEKIMAAIDKHKALNSGSVLLELTEEESKFLLLWASTGMNHERVLAQIQNKLKSGV